MAVISSLYVLPKRLYALTEKIDAVHRKLDVYHIALDEILSLKNNKKHELLEVLLCDLHKHAITLIKVKQNLNELMALDLPPMFIERTEALEQELQEMERFHDLLSIKTKALL